MHFARRVRRPRAQRGLSVVELLISVAIGMAVVAGAVQVVVSSKRNFVDQEEVIFIQTNARYALDLMARDLRMAGYLGCASSDAVQIANSIDDDAGGYVSMHGLQGFEGETDTSAFLADYRADALVGTDSFVVRRASDDFEMDVESHNPHSAVIKLWQKHEYNKGTTLMIADASCRHVGLFQVSGPSGLPAGQIVHNTGSGTNNCTKIIKGNFVCLASCTPTKCDGYTAAAGGYGPGSKIMNFVAHAYYIGDSDIMPGVPALKRKALVNNGPPTTKSEELALGVEDMEVTYGVDLSRDGVVDQFRDADDMDLDGDGSISGDEWDQVITVKVALVFRSRNPVATSAESKTLAGKDYNDRFVRQVVNSTVRIRNRG